MCYFCIGKSFIWGGYFYYLHPSISFGINRVKSRRSQHPGLPGASVWNEGLWAHQLSLTAPSSALLSPWGRLSPIPAAQQDRTPAQHHPPQHAASTLSGGLTSKARRGTLGCCASYMGVESCGKGELEHHCYSCQKGFMERVTPKHWCNSAQNIAQWDENQQSSWLTGDQICSTAGSMNKGKSKDTVD